MTDNRGGYRKPSAPAAVSGPGKLSRRTDHGQPMRVPTGLPYGDAQQLQNQERTAPMASQPPTPDLSIPQGGGGAPQGGGYQGPALDDPTQRPDEPITHGVDIGAGAGPEALGFSSAQQQPDGVVTQTLEQLSNTDTTGLLAQLYLMAQQRNV